MHYFLIITLMLSFSARESLYPDWGFYGHKLINYLAVFSLPPGLIEFYKPQAHWLREHAVDPDKRRYALPGEGIRHYIDLDHWDLAASKRPSTWREAVLLTGRYYSFTEKDTYDILWVKSWNIPQDSLEMLLAPDSTVIHLSLKDFISAISPSIELLYAPETHALPDSIWTTIGLDSMSECSLHNIQLMDQFSEHGVLPYYLQEAIERLTRAFFIRDTRSIFRLAADIGHYLSDAHVPLHTTKNYNGQLTGQLGIHAFWESRVPELLAEPEFDLWAGKAEYIEDIDSFVWKVILDSHAGVSRVLEEERILRDLIPEPAQYAFDQRGNQTVRQASRRFTRKYHERLDRQVEKRMRSAIKAVSSIWYTAWVNAGQPPLETDYNSKWNRPDPDSALLRTYESVYYPAREHESN